MKTPEDLVRLHGRFGLELADSPRGLPDHLATQLEFVHFLAFREAARRPSSRRISDRLGEDRLIERRFSSQVASAECHFTFLPGRR